jgi:hypothetical protein
MVPQQYSGQPAGWGFFSYEDGGLDALINNQSTQFRLVQGREMPKDRSQPLDTTGIKSLGCKKT